VLSTVLVQIVLALGAASAAAWIYLLIFRGGFWRVREETDPALAGSTPSVAAVVPARNEEAVVGRAIESLVKQEYAGPYHVFLVDDHSSDQTIKTAGVHERLTVLQAGPMPAGWTGKLWAVSEGLKRAMALAPDYILLTDADIVHSQATITRLLARAQTGNFDLVSWMVKLRCETLAERALIPAFVLFFFMLYPPSWIASPRRRTAGAAGGCMLIRRTALERIGGVEAIRSEVIDDCALARLVKAHGSIWLGATHTAQSIRAYDTFSEIARMISRSAFTQLRHSGLLLAGTLIGMALIYVLPPLLLFTGDSRAIAFGLTTWALMTISYLPILRFYSRSFVWAPALPLIAIFYLGTTLQSAFNYWSGKGGQWKGRIQDARR